MHFLTVVLKIKSNSTQVIKGISVRITRGKEKLYGSIRHIAAMLPPVLVKVFDNLDRHFPKSHKLHKIFNRNNAKISYNSMPNFGSIINSHNKNIINSNIPQPAATCNCRLKSSCPLNGNCMQSSLVYICKADTLNIIEN